MTENTRLRWFDPHPRCRCGRVAEGVLRGDGNESYGYHCKRCAVKRLKDSERERRLVSETIGPANAG
jgi:hypothetical protein